MFTHRTTALIVAAALLAMTTRARAQEPVRMMRVCDRVAHIEVEYSDGSTARVDRLADSDLTPNELNHAGSLVEYSAGDELAYDVFVRPTPDADIGGQYGYPTLTQSGSTTSTVRPGDEAYRLWSSPATWPDIPRFGYYHDWYQTRGRTPPTRGWRTNRMPWRDDAGPYYPLERLLDVGVVDTDTYDAWSATLHEFYPRTALHPDRLGRYFVPDPSWAGRDYTWQDNPIGGVKPIVEVRIGGGGLFDGPGDNPFDMLPPRWGGFERDVRIDKTRFMDGPLIGGELRVVRVSVVGEGSGELEVYRHDADLSLDGRIDGVDVATFLDAFVSGDPVADLVCDGELSGLDAAEFLSLYEGS